MDHDTYVFARVADLMEGVASAAASLAATLRLGRLVVLDDSNPISHPAAAAANLPFSEDVEAHFDAYGWHVQRIVATPSRVRRSGRRGSAPAHGDPPSA